MIQRSRIAPPPEALALRRGRGKALQPRPARRAAKFAAAALLFVAAVGAAPAVLGSGFVRERLGAAAGLAAAAGHAARTALWVAFESIPVR